VRTIAEELVAIDDRPITMFGGDEAQQHARHRHGARHGCECRSSECIVESTDTEVVPFVEMHSIVGAKAPQ